MSRKDRGVILISQNECNSMVFSGSVGVVLLDGFDNVAKLACAALDATGHGH